jgi:hypothetical protein
MPEIKQPTKLEKLNKLEKKIRILEKLREHYMKTKDRKALKETLDKISELLDQKEALLKD